MKHIYISPHADDVALSCGGQIIANPASHRDTLVVTAFTSEPNIAQPNSSEVETSFFRSINTFRTSEDRLAWESLEVSADQLNIPEALLRKKFPFAILPVNQVDNTKDRLFDAVHSLIKLYPDANFYFPAGIGSHVDHLACTAVAFRLLDEDILETIMLYEDVPYCWLKFIRQPKYKQLMRRLMLDNASMAHAFRPDGLTMMAYLEQKTAPFPRGKKLFVAVSVALFVNNVLHRMSAKQLPYAGKISVTRLDKADLAKKKDLLFQYKSQIPMLFGTDPDHLLEDCHDSFATETLIEISKTPR